MRQRSLEVPSPFEALAAEADAQLSLGETSPPRGERVVWLDGQRLVFPYRVYYTGTAVTAACESLAAHTRMWALCLASRHHDGRIRQRAIQHLDFEAGPWTIPFSVQLLGEYVVQIGEVIEAKIASSGVGPFARFAHENPDFIAVTLQRVISYWDCYYRSSYSLLSDYPCYRVLQAISRPAPSAAQP